MTMNPQLLIQHLTHAQAQHIDAIRLLQQIGAGYQCIHIGHMCVGVVVAGHEQRAQIRAESAHQLKRVTAAKARHHQIEDHQVDARLIGTKEI